ncbi:lipid II flippase MurJ [Cohnella sp.]|uniref:lipid II flippase MurJ n=1 Tax=Cohnella sp. TaxID=1883426 RepID=UPI0035655651
MLTLMKRISALFPDNWTVIAGVAFVNLLLAVIAFLKDVIFAGYFGTTAMADAVNMAFLLPDTIGGNLIGYVLGIAAVPHLSRIWAVGQSRQFMQAVAGLAVQCSLLLALFGLFLYLFEQQILGWFGYPDGAGTVRQLEQMFRLLLPCLVFMPLFAIGAAALQTLGSFYAPAFGPVIFNVFLLLGLVVSWASFASFELGGWIFSCSFFFGSGISAFYVWRRLIIEVRNKGSLPVGKRLSIADSLSSFKVLSPIYRDFGPLFLVILATQCLYMVERVLASRLETGTLAALSYAYRIAQFPNWVFIAALTSVILPAISRAADRSSAIEGVYRALRVTLGVMVPVAVFLCLARKPIITLLLGRGAFGPESISITCDLLAGYSLAVIGQAVSTVCLRYFLANGRMKKVVGIFSASILLSIVFDVCAIDRIGPAALGYGALLGWSVNAIWMIGLLIKESATRKVDA